MPSSPIRTILGGIPPHIQRYDQHRNLEQHWLSLCFFPAVIKTCLTHSFICSVSSTDRYAHTRVLPLVDTYFIRAMIVLLIGVLQ